MYQVGWLVASLMTPCVLAFAPTAKADQYEDAAYLTVLNQAGVPYGDSAAALTVGHGACQQISTGVPPSVYIDRVDRLSQLDRQYSARLVSIAVAAFCPAYWDESIARS